MVEPSTYEEAINPGLLPNLSSLSMMEFFPIFNLSRHILESGFTLLAFPYFLYFTSLTGHTIHTGLTGLSN